MTWTKLPPPDRSGRRIAAVSLRIYPDKGHARMRISIAPKIAQMAGIPTDRTSYADILTGEGAHAGKMRVQANADGTYVIRKRKECSTMFLLARAPDGAPDKLSATAVEATVEDGGLTFQVPWFVKAGDRVMDAPEPIELPPWPDPPYTGPRPSDVVRAIKAERESAPKTLDDVQEAARPAPKAAAVKRVTEAELLKGLQREREEREERSARVGLDLDEVDEVIDRPVNGSAKTHVYADSFDGNRKLPFKHNSKTAQMTERQFNFACKLYKAMQKNPGAHLDNDTLMRAINTKELAVLQSTAIAVESLVAPLGLVIGVIRKTGYYMREG